MMVTSDVKKAQSGNVSTMVAFDFTKTPITKIADYIIVEASKHNSSDIHFDPRENGMMVRFRIDGDLQDYTFIPKAYEKNLATRLKLLANMNITETRLPQDGAIKGTFGNTYLDMRVSCLPLNEGEKIVIRILDYSRSLKGVETLGFNPTNIEKIKRMMAIPNGIILVTGATGSGKSTTTYSMLQELNKTETNIITVEDPIEMNIEGINQVQVNSEIGMTFAAALRSILRQDPNIILIGEIRDSETAQIAVRASITGHLVLSTIHTNNSLSTIERLLDMDVERYLLSTALTGIISQRLAKQICPHCRIQREATQYEKKVFKKYMNQEITQIYDANPQGCDNCRKGYKGRIAIHEVLEIDDDIRTALNNEKLEKKDLIKMVYTNKTITLLQDGLGKVLEGQTSFEEIYRVIEIENEDDETYNNQLDESDQASQTNEPNLEEQNDLSSDVLEIPSINNTTEISETIEAPPPSEIAQDSIIEIPTINTTESPNESESQNENAIVETPLPTTEITSEQNLPIEIPITNQLQDQTTTTEQPIVSQVETIPTEANYITPEITNIKTPEIVQGGAAEVIQIPEKDFRNIPRLSTEPVE